MSDFKLFKTWGSLPTMERFVQLAAWLCDVAKVQEEPHGSNRGFWVNKFLSSAGVAPGNPWCAAFVTYCLKEVGYPDFPEGPAAVASWARWAEKGNRIVQEPKRGDLFFYLNPNGTGHIGIVLESKGGKVRTLEGNTNDEGSREGYEVCRRERAVSSLKFIRL